MEHQPNYDGDRGAPPPRDEFLSSLEAWQRWLDVSDDTTIGQLRVLVDPSGRAAGS